MMLRVTSALDGLEKTARVDDEELMDVKFVPSTLMTLAPLLRCETPKAAETVISALQRAKDEKEEEVKVVVETAVETSIGVTLSLKVQPETCTEVAVNVPSLSWTREYESSLPAFQLWRQLSRV